MGIVRNAFFPASKQDADPFKGQSPYGNVVTLASGDLGLIAGLSPGAETDRVSSELVKRLSLELWAGPSEVDTEALAAGDADGGNAAQIQQVAHDLETATIRAEGRQQSWGERRPGSWQILKEEAIGMRAEEFSDPLFVLSDERQKTFELLGQQFYSQGRGPNDGVVGGQGLGFLNQRQALEDFLFLAAVMAVEKLTQLGWRDFLELCQSRPLPQQIGRQSRGDIILEYLEGHR